MFRNASFGYNPKIAARKPSKNDIDKYSHSLNLKPSVMYLTFIQINNRAINIAVMDKKRKHKLVTRVVRKCLNVHIGCGKVGKPVIKSSAT